MSLRFGFPSTAREESILLGEATCDPTVACRSALVESLTDDAAVAVALLEVVRRTFGR